MNQRRFLVHLSIMVVCLGGLFYVAQNCKRVDQNKLSAGDSNSSDVTIGVVKEYPPLLRLFFESISHSKPLVDFHVSELAKMNGIKVTNQISFTPDAITHREPGELREVPKTDTYIGIALLPQVFVFRKDFGAGAAEKYWTPIGYLSGNILQGASLDEKVRYYLDTKIYEPKRLQELNASINTVDFIAHFIPAYAGAEKVFVTGQGVRDTVVGVVEIVGDVASLGIGSKIRIVSQGAAAVVITASTIRLANAGVTAYQGKANFGTGLDAFLATLEGGLAAVSLIKIKVTGLRGAVGSIEEAEAIATKLNRTGKDILENGISEAELKQLGVNLAKSVAEEGEKFVSPVLENMTALYRKLFGKEYDEILNNAEHWANHTWDWDEGLNGQIAEYAELQEFFLKQKYRESADFFQPGIGRNSQFKYISDDGRIVINEGLEIQIPDAGFPGGVRMAPASDPHVDFLMAVGNNGKNIPNAVVGGRYYLKTGKFEAACDAACHTIKLNLETGIPDIVLSMGAQELQNFIRLGYVPHLAETALKRAAHH